MDNKKFTIYLDKEYDSEHELYYKMISIHNVVEDWGLSSTHINIIVYLIRYGFSKDTRKIICKNLKITQSSLSTTLSHLRQGKVGTKTIKKLLETSTQNMNVTLLKQELIDIRDIIEAGKYKIFVEFKDATS